MDTRPPIFAIRFSLTVLMALGWLRAAEPPGSLKALLAEALSNNPEILASQKRYEAARQRPGQVSSLPDPMFSPGFASNGRPWPGAGLGKEPTSNIGFMVSQEVPWPGKRKLQGDMAVKEYEAEFQNYTQAQLSVVSRIKQAYYRRAYAFEVVEVLDRNIDLLRRLLKITEARYSVGKAAQQDVFKAQTQISILATKRIQLEREKRAREAEIVSLVNRAPGSSLEKPDALLPQEMKVGLEELYEAAKQNSPMLLKDEKMIQRAELAVNMARKEYYPDYTIKAGYFNMGSMPPMYQLSADFKIPLYFFRKQRPAVTEQSQTLAASRRDYEASNQSLHFRIKDDQLMAETSNQLIKLYSQTVIPQSSLALESSLSSYETGSVDFLTVLMNYVTVVEYEMNYYEELQNYYLAVSRLEEMTGRSLLP
ncbi:TolC family protein [Paludibaculum fermentans]|uniref:TolC family protein n=1 Tax=Paludibaculum fermentans TaxID=1473598 RepID=A0A7S7SKP9_PALFE|nr:TolC family protein [Paludibaculum fermentans]QOY87651.1 TolC family protein [Paludibaculum fermentans]